MSSVQPEQIEVFILCGGEGKRLRSLVSDLPKPMAPIGSKPFLHFLVEDIVRQGFRNICFLTSYKSEIIKNYFQENFQHLSMRFSNEENPLGTGGAIFLAEKSSSFEKYLVINGDTFFHIDLRDFIKNWQPGSLKIALKKMPDISRYGRVEVGKNDEILSFIEKDAGTTGGAEGLINGGIYLCDRTLCAIGREKKGFVSLEKDIFPLLLKQNKLFSQAFSNDFIDIGIPEDYIKAQSLIEKWIK